MTGFRVMPDSLSEYPVVPYMVGGAVIGATTLVSLPFSQATSYFTPAILYLFVLTTLGTFLARGPLLLSAVMSALLWDYLFIPPRYTLYIERVEDILMFLAYFAIAAASGVLTWRIQRSKEQLLREERRMAALYELSGELGIAKNLTEVAATSSRQLAKAFLVPGRILLVEEGVLRPAPLDPEAPEEKVDSKEAAVADWVFHNGRPAGRFTDTLLQAPARFLPMSTPGGVIGVLRIELDRPLDPLGENLLQTMTAQIALAVEREQLAERERTLRMAEESERLSRILMNTVSHELRSPLTAIMGASSALLDEAIAERPELRRGLLDELWTSADRLNRLVDNLLDMSRLESGHLKLRRAPATLHEIVAECLSVYKRELEEHNVILSLDDSLPEIEADQNLLVTALGCIVHNAAVHTPAGTSITIETRSALSGSVCVVIRDDGPGVSNEELAGLFDRFYGGRRARGMGAGLGLSLARGIVELHGGSLVVKRGSDRGLVFSMTLPVKPGGEPGSAA